MGDHGHHHHKHQDEPEHIEHKGENLNFSAAYIHILSDALTSIIAIVALVLGKYLGLIFLDPIMGIVGGVLILKWSVNLIKKSFKVFLEY